MAQDAVDAVQRRFSRRDCRTWADIWSIGLRSIAAGAVASLVLLSGCGDFFNPPATSTGSSTTTTDSGDTFYVANSNTSLNSVTAVLINSGTITDPTAYTLPTGVTPSALAITPDSGFLYVASEVLDAGGIYEYSINSDGSLTAQNSGAVQTVTDTLQPQAIVVDPSGQWLIAFQSSVVGSVGGATTATVFSINASTGALSNPNGAVEQLTIDSGSVGQVVFNPAGTTLYATLGAPISGTANSGGVDILSFVSSTGALTLSGNLAPIGTADIGLAINPTGTFLFVTETGSVTGLANGTNGVRSLSIGSTGQLTQVGSYNTDLGAGAVLVDSTGAYVYVANRSVNTISAFSISSTGTLTQIGTAISSVGTTPVAMVEDNSNTYVGVICSGGSPDLQFFTFDATTAGQLDPYTAGTISTGNVSPADAIAIVATH